MDVAHLMTLDVVEEDTLALDESLVFLARDVWPMKPGLTSPSSTTSGRSGVTVVSVIARPP